MEDELKTHPLALFFCDLALSKGKVILFYLLEGLTKVANYIEVADWMNENNITADKLKELLKQYRGGI